MMILLLALLLGLGLQLAAVAQEATPTPEPTPTPTPDPNATPEDEATPEDDASAVEPVSNDGIWDSFNDFMFDLVDKLLSIWPSTPDGLKLSFLLDKLQDLAPLVPWFAVAEFITGALGVLTLLSIWKVAKTFWSGM